MGMSEPVYDRIGGSYTEGRREEPRIAARLARALGDADSVVNVGAGTGSYEPADRRVAAVEPSPVMAAQRPAGSAPCVRAAAEALPFADGAFGAGMDALSRDLASGEWRRKYGHLLELDELDLGYRVIIAQVTDRLPT
jgi:hypothetical protein